MFRLLDKVRQLEATGRTIIHLEIGDPDFATPPSITEAGRASLAAGETHNNDAFASPAMWDECRDRMILSNGFSKTVAMTGWRPGTVIRPEAVMERMMLLLQTTSSCVAPFVQQAGAEARGDQSEVIRMMSEYRMTAACARLQSQRKTFS